jgi:hypothetical protein
MSSSPESCVCSKCGFVGMVESDGHLPIGWKYAAQDPICPMCWGPITERSTSINQETETQ